MSGRFFQIGDSGGPVDFERMIAELNAATERRRGIIGTLARKADAAETISRQLQSRPKKKLRLKSAPSSAKAAVEPKPESRQAKMRALAKARIERLKEEFYEPQCGRKPPPDPMVLEEAYFDEARKKLNAVRAMLPRAVKRKRRGSV